MMTIARTLADARRQLNNSPCVSESARLDAEVLLSDVLHCDRSYLYAWPEKVLTPEQNDLFSAKLQRRIHGEPVAYLTGRKEFYSLLLEVNDSTLIPRPETETLVDIALQLLPATTCRVLDLGTGSGAIALALAYASPAWQVSAVDCELRAVELAQRNARTYGLSNVDIRQSDWFTAVNHKEFDLVVSNPPYIDSTDLHLQQGDVRFEPKTALVSEKNGLADIEIIISHTRQYLKAQGWLMLEHGYLQAEKVRALFDRYHFTAVETFVDLSGKDRVTIGQQSSGGSMHG